MRMKQLGVDLGPVNGFDGLEKAVNSIKRSDNKVFIVKDDYVLNSLNAYFLDLGIRDYTIYTVKSVKGLEFKGVYVIDIGMSPQEKYISYTRALANLSVIKGVPFSINRDNSLIVQGEEE